VFTFAEIGPHVLTFSVSRSGSTSPASALAVDSVQLCAAIVTPTSTASPSVTIGPTLSLSGTATATSTGSLTASATPSPTSTSICVLEGFEKAGTNAPVGWRAAPYPLVTQSSRVPALSGVSAHAIRPYAGKRFAYLRANPGVSTTLSVTVYVDTENTRFSVAVLFDTAEYEILAESAIGVASLTSQHVPTSGLTQPPTTMYSVTSNDTANQGVQQTPWLPLSFTLAEIGPHVLTFAVSSPSTHSLASALAIDAVAICASIVTPTPRPTSTPQSQRPCVFTFEPDSLLPDGRFWFAGPSSHTITFANGGLSSQAHFQQAPISTTSGTHFGAVVAGAPENYITASFSFYAASGNATVSFQVLFETSEMFASGGAQWHNDDAFVALYTKDGPQAHPVFSATIFSSTAASILPPYNGTGRSEWIPVTFSVPSAGIYTLTFGVRNAVDGRFPSVLAFDNVNVCDVRPIPICLSSRKVRRTLAFTNGAFVCRTYSHS